MTSGYRHREALTTRGSRERGQALLSLRSIDAWEPLVPWTTYGNWVIGNAAVIMAWRCGGRSNSADPACGVSQRSAVLSLTFRARLVLRCEQPGHYEHVESVKPAGAALCAPPPLRLSSREEIAAGLRPQTLGSAGDFGPILWQRDGSLSSTYSARRGSFPVSFCGRSSADGRCSGRMGGQEAVPITTARLCIWHIREKSTPWDTLKKHVPTGRRGIAPVSVPGGVGLATDRTESLIAPLRPCYVGWTAT